MPSGTFFYMTQPYLHHSNQVYPYQGFMWKKKKEDEDFVQTARGEQSLNPCLPKDVIDSSSLEEIDRLLDVASSACSRQQGLQQPRYAHQGRFRQRSWTSKDVILVSAIKKASRSSKNYSCYCLESMSFEERFWF